MNQKGGIICKIPPKTDAGNRRVAVPISTLEGLREFHQEMSLYFEEHHLPRSKLIFPTIYGNYMCDRNERATLKNDLSNWDYQIMGFTYSDIHMPL